MSNPSRNLSPPTGDAIIAPLRANHHVTSARKVEVSPTPTRSSGEDQQQQELLLSYLAKQRPLVIKPQNGFIEHPYCIPGGFYEQQWDWDGFFIASHLAARNPAEPQYLKYWVLNVLKSRLPDGDTAACITPEGPKVAHKSLRLKPFLAQAAELGARLLKDYSWVEENYDEIVRISTRRRGTHFVDRYGLYVWEDAMQSGADNNPAIGNGDDVTKMIAACDVNTFMYREYLALAEIARSFDYEEDHIRFSEAAEGIHSAIHEYLWDSENESYWNLNVGTGQWCKRVSYSNFVPLWAGMAQQDQAEAMILRYLWNEEHMLCPHGLRSLSRKDVDYNNINIIIPYSNWQGPVWPIANYFFFVSLFRYGFLDEARELVRRLTRLYLRDFEFCGSLHENYDAETGMPMAPSAEQSKHGLEGGFLGWNLLLEDMIEILNGHPHLLELNPPI